MQIMHKYNTRTYASRRMHKSYSIKMRVEFFASMDRGKGGGGLMEEEKSRRKYVVL
jgi:hypothetical protein